MSFAYNENACRVVIDVFSKRLERIRNDIEFLERERTGTSELAAHYAISEAIGRLEFDRSCAELKIKEMQTYLDQSPNA